MLTALQANWKALTLIGAILMAGGYGATEVLAVKQMAASNSKWIAQQEFFRLDDRRARFGLNRREWARWCYFGRRTKLMMRCPPFRMNPRTKRSK